MASGTTHTTRFVRIGLLLALLLSFVSTPLPAQAQASAPAAPTDATARVTPAPGGVDLEWGTSGDVSAAQAAANALPKSPYQGYMLPMQLITLALPDGVEAKVDIGQLTAGELPGGIAPAEPMLPPALDWTPDPNAYAPETPALPDAPVFVLREGKVHGQRFVVVAFSPVYQEAGTVKIASRLAAHVPNAVPLTGDVQEATVAAGVSAAAATETVAIPVNDAALQPSYKIIVSQPGIQEVLYSAVGLAGKPETEPRLTYNGALVGVELAADRFRFYAPEVGDRWNTTSVYWLSTGESMKMLEPQAAFSYPAGVATERGTWTQNKVYESVYPGADGDRWFHMDMRATPGADPAKAAATTVVLSGVLPPAGGTTFAVHSTAYIIPPMSRCQSGEKGYIFQATVQAAGGQTETLLGQWNPAPGCVMQPTSAVTFTTSLVPQSIELRFLPNPDYPTAIKLEHITWERPVSLNVAGLPKGGAEFWSEEEGVSYTFTNLPASWQLYDVTDAQPRIAAKGGAGSFTFNQFGRAPVSHYVLANLGDVHQPAVQQHTAVNFSAVKAANAIYIGPASFADELAPLLNLRSQQGYTPLFVDVQQIYDVFNYGHVSATAIRNFLRQETDWQNTARRISVVLAGDGTHDPHDYEGRANANHVTPYMDDVDLYINEAPCDQCYAQLNGEDPKTGDNTVDGNGKTVNWFAADIWLGRFPVRNETELAEVVSKLVNYETTGHDQDPWRSRHVLLADNYMLHLDNQSNAMLDAAGDFASYSDNVRSLFPANAQTQRVYFDPAPGRQVVLQDGEIVRVGATGYVITEPRTAIENWRIADPTAVNQAAVTALSGGAGLVTYNGHSNHFYYARTREDGAQPNWLFYTNDVAALGNNNKPFIMLSMTCYTSQFSKPTGAGTLDELMFRRREAGAVAVWGPAGLTIVHGHDLLQTGFLNRLWSQPAMSQRIGELVEAGYLELLTKGTCDCQDALMTFLLFGDPLTRARVGADRALYMPQVRK